MRSNEILDLKLEKSEPMAVEILDKREDTNVVPIRVGKITTVQTRHYYYINTEVGDFSVGNNVYDKYDKGDIVFVTKTDVYKIKDGKEIYIKTKYEWEIEMKMKRIIRGRGHSKTWDLIDYAVKNDAIIVCYTQAHCKAIEQMAEYHKGVKVETMSFQDVMDGKLRGNRRKVVIDEMELALRCVFNSKGAEVIGWNMSME